MKAKPSQPSHRLLSNGHFTSLITAAGAGFSRRDWVGLNRWSGDRVEDREGYAIYLRDLDSDAFWSAGLQPTARPAERYRVERMPGRLRIERRDHGIDTELDIAVAADADLEVRRVTLHNRSKRPRRIELTSFIEVVLNHPAADAAHPAFSKLFVQTEFVADDGLLLAHRRPRSAGETGLWMVHGASGGDDLQFETDRARFIGRGCDVGAPSALLSSSPLSGTAGNVLDPCFSLRRSVLLAPGETTRICFRLGTAPTRDAALHLCKLHGDAVDELFAGAADAERKLCSNLGITAERAAYFESLAGAMLYGETALRAPSTYLATSAGSPALLERYDLPASGLLCVAFATGPDDAKIDELVRARRYWQAKGLTVALLIFAEQRCWQTDGEPVSVRSAADVPRNEFDAILSLAHCVIAGDWPALPPAPMPPAGPAPQARPESGYAPIVREDGRPLDFFNGYGGFSTDGSEYVMRVDALPDGCLRRPPLAWINTIANERCGFLVSDSGAGYLWARNSREHRITPWSNDPIVDPHGEAVYLRDDDSGACWSPTPGPMPAAADYRVVHGFGYSRFEHCCHGLDQELTVFVPRNDPLRIARLRLINRTNKTRRLSCFSYQRLVLGGAPADHARFVVSDYDADHTALLAVNRYAGEFADGVVVAAPVAPEATFIRHTADRESFIGRHGSPAQPLALTQAGLNGATGAGLDPCAAFQVGLELAPGDIVDCAFLLGETQSHKAALALVARYREPDAIDAALADVTRFWRQTLGAVQIKTPVPEVDLMVNGWLSYQNLSCRLWGRSAFYQSGGAYGYRDQLQDAGALIYSRPDLTRAQILLHAAHQFVDGDVLHWWHPAPIDRGLRTRFSDDLLWLPYICAFYVRSTGDWGVLDEIAPFVTARPLDDGEDEAYLRPQDSGLKADVYEHCCRALDRSLTAGVHGLPLMGTGDWNDGMNRVGREGRGESVWMGFFLVRIIADFLPICERRGDRARIEAYQAYRDKLTLALNDGGWDGDWYRRAYYDNGAVLGSKDSDECQIDALAQAWSVISGAAPPGRAQSAMDAVERRLISERPGLIRLLTPAFQDTPNDPGYIKGYVAGVRENGGQYTHAACWVVRAMAELGRRDRAAGLLAMLSPVSHTSTTEDASVYRVEPYVIAADVYGEPPHVGRGGWTWYTGSAGWMYRVALESVLGFTLEGGDAIRLKPCIPDDWAEFDIGYRPADGGYYRIHVGNPDGCAASVRSATLDGAALTVEQGAVRIPLVGDGGEHEVELVLGTSA